MSSTNMHPLKTAFFAVAVASTALRAQLPIGFRPGLVEPRLELPPALVRAIEERTRQYPFDGFQRFGKDSALLVFADSALTAESLRSNRWTFGPSVTAAEADSCPPEKVLGRKVARIYWRAAGRPKDIEYVMVAVHGTNDKDRWTVVTMYYSYGQLAAPWIGDEGASSDSPTFRDGARYGSWLAPLSGRIYDDVPRQNAVPLARR